ncbi:MAG: dehydrogenase [Schlesneria sp.]|nr:dehydrogenase [Schlesneria sp.]
MASLVPHDESQQTTADDTMPADIKQYGLGLIGAGPFSHHLLERLLLRKDLMAVAACFGSQPARPNSPLDCEVHSQPRAVIENPRTQIVYFAEPASPDIIELAIQYGKVVVLTSTIGLTSGELSRLAGLAAVRGILAVVDEPRRWGDDFLSAKAVFDAGQLGKLQRVRLAIHETSLPGETFSNGVLWELGGHWFDQLLVFTTTVPEAVQLRRFYGTTGTADVGFLATIDFREGISAVVEVQTASLLSLRTGWLLEGATGAYRAGRQYSKTPDGEIIDEPVTVPVLRSDPFLDNLVKSLAGDQTGSSQFVTLSHAVRTSVLIELLENSAPSI